MAELKLFTPEELAERKKPKRQQQREARERMVAEYARALATARPGFAGEINLSEGDDKRKIQTLLKEAAERNTQFLRFRPIKNGSRIEFTLVGPEQKPQKRGGRRPKKSA